MVRSVFHRVSSRDVGHASGGEVWVVQLGP
jgi:hypothetical protein